MNTPYIKKASTNTSDDVVWHQHTVGKQQRIQLKPHRPCVLWFTGLSGSGKSTIANEVEKQLNQAQCHTYLLDGDNIRHGLNRDLGFSDTDRVENIRRIAEVANLFADAGMMVLSAFISPFRSERQAVRALLPEGEFIEVYVDTPLAICEARDPKGLYRQARAGEITQFTGIDSPYEPPEQAEVHIKTEGVTVQEAAKQVIDYLAAHQFIQERAKHD